MVTEVTPPWTKQMGVKGGGDRGSLAWQSRSLQAQVGSIIRRVQSPRDKQAHLAIAAVLLLFEAALSALIILKVSCTSAGLSRKHILSDLLFDSHISFQLAKPWFSKSLLTHIFCCADTEIDWSTYMQQVHIFLQVKLEHELGSLLKAVGLIYSQVFWLLKHLIENGQHHYRMLLQL